MLELTWNGSLTSVTVTHSRACKSAQRIASQRNKTSAATEDTPGKSCPPHIPSFTATFLMASDQHWAKVWATFRSLPVCRSIACLPALCSEELMNAPRHWTPEGRVPLCLRHSSQMLKEENISQKGLLLPEVSQAFSQASSAAYHSQARQVFMVWNMKLSATEWLTMNTSKRTRIYMQSSDSRAQDFLPL